MDGFPQPPAREPGSNGWHAWAEAVMREIWTSLREFRNDSAATCRECSDRTHRMQQDFEGRMREMERVMNRGIGIMIAVSALSGVLMFILSKLIG